MKFELIKTVNPKFKGIEEVEIDFTNKKVGEKVKLFDEEVTIVQLGESPVLIGQRGDDQVLYVLNRVYEEEPYITDYNHIKEPDDLIVNETEKVFVIKHPMSLEALYKYIQHNAPTPEPSIKMVGDNEFEFINGWKLYGSESHKNIKSGKYSYESKVVFESTRKAL